MLKRLVSTLLFGSTLGTAPYVVATSLPSSVQEKEEGKFGETCLLSKEICDFMRETKFETERDIGQEDDSPDYPLKVSKQTWKTYIEKAKKAFKEKYCGWGFVKKEEFNTVEECYESLKKEEKSKKK